MSKKTTTFSLTDVAIDFFTEYGDGNRSKGAERAAADLADKPRLETVQGDKAEAAAREWEWILGLDDNERMGAAREYPPRAIAAIEGRPKSAYLKKSLAATKRVAELSIEGHTAHRALMASAAEFPVPSNVHMPAYLLEEYEAKHGHPLPRIHVEPKPSEDASDPLEE